MVSAARPPAETNGVSDGDLVIRREIAAAAAVLGGDTTGASALRVAAAPPVSVSPADPAAEPRTAPASSGSDGAATSTTAEKQAAERLASDSAGGAELKLGTARDSDWGELAVAEEQATRMLRRGAAHLSRYSLPPRRRHACCVIYYLLK